MSEIEDHYPGESLERSPASSAGYHEQAAIPQLARRAERQPRANPDDPPVQRPPHGPHGPLPGPHEPGSPGRIAIVQGQVFIVGTILVIQLWLVTDALLSLLSGHPQDLGWLTLASGAGFVIALVIWLWPRRRTHGL